MANFTWFNGEKPDGLPIRQVYGIVFGADGSVLLRIEDEKYKLTGGKPEGNETFEETLRREYLEELNTDVEDINYLGYLLVDDGDRYAQVRMVARIKDMHDIQVDPATGKTYGRDLIKHPNITYDGVLPFKIKNEVVLKDWVLAIVAPSTYKGLLEAHVSKELAAKVFFVDNDAKDIWEWSEKVYEFAKRIRASIYLNESR